MTSCSELLERARARSRVQLERAKPVARALLSKHDPWHVEVRGGCAGQRPFRRSRAAIRVIVAGRQSGKTHEVAEEVVRICLARPGTESCLLMPNYKSSKGALRHLRRALEPLGTTVEWREGDKFYVFPNGAKLYVRTSDDKSGVPTRGLTLDGCLWVDEAVFVARSAWDAAQKTLAAVADPKVVVTTTARGRAGWVFELVKEAKEQPDGYVEFFRFRTTDSPHHNPHFVASVRRRIGEQQAQEEFDAVFVGGSRMPFSPDDVAEALARGRDKSVRGRRLTIGVDLAKSRDYTVLVLVNEHGEAWVLDRFRAKRSKTGQRDQRFWAQALPRIKQHVNAYKGCKVVVDVARGAGVGEFVADELTAAIGKKRVVRQNTGVSHEKTKLVEGLIAAFENGQVTLSDQGAHVDELQRELVHFPPPEEEEHEGGVVRIYRGPRESDRAETEDGEEDELHDDTVIALALAWYGSTRAWGPDRPRTSLAALSSGKPSVRGQRSNDGFSYRFGGRKRAA